MFFSSVFILFFLFSYFSRIFLFSNLFEFFCGARGGRGKPLLSPGRKKRMIELWKVLQWGSACILPARKRQKRPKKKGKALHPTLGHVLLQARGTILKGTSKGTERLQTESGKQQAGSN